MRHPNILSFFRVPHVELTSEAVHVALDTLPDSDGVLAVQVPAKWMHALCTTFSLPFFMVDWIESIMAAPLVGG